MRDFADRNGYELVKVFAIQESAAGKIQRKIFHEMMEYVTKAKINTIFVETTDRLTRNFADVPVIDEWILADEKHTIHLVKESCTLHKDSKSHEWFMWRVKVATAEYYIRLLSENVKKGHKEKLAQGWYPSKAPLGYKSIGDKGHKTHIIDPEKGPLVLKMFELYSTGSYSLSSLVERMFKDGLRTYNGNRLVKSRMASLLSYPFYYGVIPWLGQIHPGNHKPLVSKDLFDRVQDVLKGKTTPKRVRHFFAFQGKIRCLECNGLVTWETKKGYDYGHCNKYNKCTVKKWYKQPDLEVQLYPAFEKLQIKNPRLLEWVKKAIKESNGEEAGFHASALAELQKQHGQVKARLDNLYDDKLDGKISEEMYDRKRQQYTLEEKTILKSITEHSETGNKYQELGVALYDLAQRAKDIFVKADDVKKRQLIELVLTNIRIYEGQVVYDYTKPFQILFDTVEETNSLAWSAIKKIFEENPRVTIELENSTINKGRTPSFEVVRPMWLPN